LAAANPRLLEFSIILTAGKDRRTSVTEPSELALSTKMTSKERPWQKEKSDARHSRRTVRPFQFTITTDTRGEDM
jgi:hypothetical protein